MIKREDMEELEQQVRMWLKSRGIPFRRYENLQAHDKFVLRSLVCIPAQLTTPGERRSLYRKLCMPEIVAGRDAIDPVDSMTDEALRDFFSSLPPSQGTLVDWGCE